MKQRFKNYGLWVSLTALLVDIGIYSHVIPAAEADNINMFVHRGLEILVMLGIVSNPTKPDGSGYNL